jgi:polyhydroxybutyrate depolymerase
MISTVVIGACGGGSVATPKASPSPSAVQHGYITMERVSEFGGTTQMQRTYRLYVPPALDSKQPAPLLVALTGCPSSGDEMAGFTHLDDQAKTGGFIVVYPDPVEGCWNAGRLCCSFGTGADDSVFISQLLDRLTTELHIDKARIFAAGLSAGGMMAYRLACEISDRIAAIASVAGTMVVDDCRPARPVSILEMHGTADTHVIYAGGESALGSTLPSPVSAIQRWVALDGCASDSNQAESGITKTSIWTGCRGGTVVRFDTVEGGRHTWFGSVAVDLSDPVSGEPNASEVVWAFFRTLAPRA